MLQYKASARKDVKWIVWIGTISRNAINCTSDTPICINRSDDIATRSKLCSQILIPQMVIDYGVACRTCANVSVVAVIIHSGTGSIPATRVVVAMKKHNKRIRTAREIRGPIDLGPKLRHPTGQNVIIIAGWKMIFLTVRRR